jgi:hypothetical protein
MQDAGILNSGLDACYSNSPIRSDFHLSSLLDKATVSIIENRGFDSSEAATL